MPAKKTTKKVAKKAAKKVTKKVAKKAVKKVTKKAAKKVAKKAPKSEVSAEAPVAKPAPSHEEIEKEAFFKYLRRCELGIPGTPEDDWAAALAELAA